MKGRNGCLQSLQGKETSQGPYADGACVERVALNQVTLYPSRLDMRQLEPPQLGSLHSSRPGDRWQPLHGR
jgi:hypothetical protein